MNANIKYLFFYVLISLISFASSSHATESANYKMRWVLAHEPVRVFARAAKHFSDEVAKETKGHVQIEIIDGRDLNQGKTMGPEQAFTLVKNGQIEMTQTYTTFLGNHSAPFWALDLPFLFRDHEHAAKVLQGPIGDKILSGLQAENIRGLAFTYSGGYMIVPTATKEIHSVEDFKGLKVSVNNNSPVGTALMKSLGAVPVPTQQVSEKNLDGFETTYVRFAELNEDVQKDKKIINDLRHSLFLTAILVNKKYFEAMPVNYQEAIRRAARAAAVLEREDSIRDGLATKDQFASKGFKLVVMAPDQMDRFKNQVGPVYAKFEPMFGKDLIHNIQSQ